MNNLVNYRTSKHSLPPAKSTATETMMTLVWWRQ